jgi:probable addiction module antidote protein
MEGQVQMAIGTRIFDAANYIPTPEDQAALLNDAISDGDPRYIAYALGAIARARGGIAKVAMDTGLSRQALHKALSENGNPTLGTVLKVLTALGLQMRIGERELADA